MHYFVPVSFLLKGHPMSHVGECAVLESVATDGKITHNEWN